MIPDAIGKGMPGVTFWGYPLVNLMSMNNDLRSAWALFRRIVRDIMTKYSPKPKDGVMRGEGRKLKWNGAFQETLLWPTDVCDQHSPLFLPLIKNIQLKKLTAYSSPRAANVVHPLHLLAQSGSVPGCSYDQLHTEIKTLQPSQSCCFYPL